MNVFQDLFGSLPRQGPGTDADTLSALAHTDLAERRGACVLDVGCGTGTSTLALARAGDFDITALDLMPGNVAALEKSLADAHDLRSRVSVLQADMRVLAFPDESFDAVWCEGAIYILGFRQGLERFAPLVRPGGWICATELSWRVDTPPLEALQFWAEEYPGMGSIEANLQHARDVGLETEAHFALGADAFWDHYYGPMQQRMLELAPRYAKDDTAVALFEALEREIDVFLRYGPHVYSYVFYVLRRPATPGE